MKVKDVKKEIEKFAHPLLKESYDNIGLMVGSNDKCVKKVLVALDCTNEVINEGKKEKVDLIITHHPLIFKKPSKIIYEDLQGKKIIDLIKSNISLYSCHTNLDSAQQGINKEVVKMLGFNKSQIIEKSKIEGFEEAGIGRIIDLDEEMSILDLINLLKEKLNIKTLRIAKGKETTKRLAIINGSGQDFFEKALKKGADCIVTGDTTYHFVSDYKEMGITIIDAGHFNTEALAFKNVMKKIEDKLSDIEFIYSKVTSDPYEYI